MGYQGNDLLICDLSVIDEGNAKPLEVVFCFKSFGIEKLHLSNSKFMLNISINFAG